MSVAILLSPGYGSGWSSDYSGSDEERLFLLTYPGFIEALDKQRLHDEAKDSFAHKKQHWGMTPELPDSIEVIEACLAAEEAIRRFEPNLLYACSADQLRFAPYELVKALPKFLEEWGAKFSNHWIPLGGFHQLRVEIVSDLSTLHIKRFDGAESIGYRRGIWE